MTTIHQHSPSVTERLYKGQKQPHTPTRQYSHSRSRSALDGMPTEIPRYGMTDTYTWAAEQEFLRGGSCIGSPPRRETVKTEDWVREQRTMHKASELLETETIYLTASTASSRTTSKTRRREWEELIYVYEVEAEQWIRQEERARRVASEREKTRLRIQDELRRIEARYQQKRDAERIARDEAKRREWLELKEREKRDRVRHGKLVADAWSRYESRWSSLPSSTEPLTFKTTPWPLTAPPRCPEDITHDSIVAFLFSHQHSQDQSRKDRIRAAQLRWHPDRFRRFLGRVAGDDKAVVEEGVNIVARILNDLMEKEKKKAR